MGREQILTINPQYTRETRSLRDKQGVVFILGWVGSDFRKLYSFSQIYESLGIASIIYRFNPSTFHSVYPRVTVANHAKLLLKELYSHDFADLPVFFHLFSNGGSIMYLYLLKELEKPEHSGIRVSGIVYDSCPSNFITPETISNYLRVMAVDKPILNKALGQGICCAAYVNIGLNKAYDLLTGADDKYSLEKLYFARNTITNLSNRDYPHLFMYSNGDRIVRQHEIEQFANDRAKQGVKVVKYCFDNSDHCTHRHVFPKEYANKIKKFILEDCFDKIPASKKDKELEKEHDFDYNISGFTKIQAYGLSKL